MTEEKKPESSLLKSWAYDEGTQILTVTFQDKQNKTTGVTTFGATYKYQPVPMSVWQDFQTSESKGKFFLQHIKPAGFRYWRVEDDDDGEAAD